MKKITETKTYRKLIKACLDHNEGAIVKLQHKLLRKELKRKDKKN